MMATRGLICFMKGPGIASEFGQCDASFCRTDCGNPLPIGEALLEEFNTPEQALALSRFGYMPHMADNFDELHAARQAYLEKQPRREEAFAYISEAGLDEEGIPWSCVRDTDAYRLQEAMRASVWIEGAFGFLHMSVLDAPQWHFIDFDGCWPHWTPLSQAIEEDELRQRVFRVVCDFRNELEQGMLFHRDYGKFRTLEEVEIAFTEKIPAAYLPTAPELNGYVLSFVERCLCLYFESKVASFVRANLPNGVEEVSVDESRHRLSQWLRHRAKQEETDAEETDARETERIPAQKKGVAGTADCPD